MAFGVVVAGTGALSGTGGQKRYRVNRFCREIYHVGRALGGGGGGASRRGTELATETIAIHITLYIRFSPRVYLA